MRNKDLTAMDKTLNSLEVNKDKTSLRHNTYTYDSDSMLPQDRTVHTIYPISDNFLENKTVLYIGNGNRSTDNHIEDLTEDFIEGLPSRFADVGYSFVFIPEILAQLSPDMIEIAMPVKDSDSANTITADELYRNIRDLLGFQCGNGFLYRTDNELHFWTITPFGNRQVIDKSDHHEETTNIAISHQCRTAEVIEDSLKHGNAENQIAANGNEQIDAAIDGFIDFLSANTLHEPQTEYRIIRTRMPKDGDEDDGPAWNPSNKDMDILQAWWKFSREYGVSLNDMQVLLSYKVKLSHLRITASGNITLPDFEGKEIKMDNLTKAVYFFYLNHPEGVRQKELQCHEDEILGYYLSLTGRDDVNAIRQSLHNHLDPYGNNVNVSLSRIKKAFRDALEENVAKYYYVDGGYGKPRYVSLDRKLVIWEAGKSVKG